MLARLKRIGRQTTDSDAHYECRRCGTNVEAPRSACPACDSPDIARYDF